MCWQGLLLAGFDRAPLGAGVGAGLTAGVDAEALDLWESRRCTWLEALVACHPVLGLGELARLFFQLEKSRPELAREFATSLFAAYGLRSSDRMLETLRRLFECPLKFQNLVDDKKFGVRDLAPLLAVKDVGEIALFLNALCDLELSKSLATQALELVIELYLLGRPLNDLLPTSNDGGAYVERLLAWRRPKSSLSDEQWSQTVSQWPWPAQVHGSWQRFGDQTGIEIKIRTTSPQDLDKKLERLSAIPETWSCKS